ncbi:MAG TPA: hypothetical protein VGV64_03910 [Thermoplasmata archaeon]|nr:hypothetical protein [Thermoplasmata archaeon]HEV2428977.1 hypothetical protein [Thermoplasmata archaeon]
MMSYERRRPPLYRLARYLRWSAILALVVVVVFLVSTVISAIEFASKGKVSTAGGKGYSFAYSAATGFTAAFGVNITNAGSYPLVLDLSAVAHTGWGPLVPYASTGAVTIAPGNRTTTFGLTFQIPATTLSSDGARLLLNNTPIVGNLWLNGTYAWVYQFGITLAANASWGAPFENLSVRPGTPAMAANRTTVSATIAFTDNASFADVGNLTFQVVDAGADCGPPVELALDVPAHRSFSAPVNLSGPSSCMVPGATVTTTYSLGSSMFALPSSRVG